MANVKSILQEWLETNGFDGLWSQDNECCCKRSDLAPTCDGPTLFCEPGYLVPMVCDFHDFHIGPEKTDVIDVCSRS